MQLTVFIWSAGTQPPNNPDPGTNPPEAALAYDASSWETVQLPHDGLIASAPTESGCPGGCSGKSYIQRKVLWYRKEFTLPVSWTNTNDAVWLDFEGAFRKAVVWINGDKVLTHASGYTPFRLRLDNITSIKAAEKNAIAVFVDPDNGDGGGRDHGSGWWYEGGGLYRHVNLVKASKLHIAEDGIFAYSNITHSDAGLEAWNGGTPRRYRSLCLSPHLSPESAALLGQSSVGQSSVALQDDCGVCCAPHVCGGVQ